MPQLSAPSNRACHEDFGRNFPGGSASSKLPSGLAAVHCFIADEHLRAKPSAPCSGHALTRASPRHVPCSPETFTSATLASHHAAASLRRPLLLWVGQVTFAAASQECCWVRCPCRLPQGLGIVCGCEAALLTQLCKADLAVPPHQAICSATRSSVTQLQLFAAMPAFLKRGIEREANAA